MIYLWKSKNLPIFMHLHGKEILFYLVKSSSLNGNVHFLSKHKPFWLNLPKKTFWFGDATTGNLQKPLKRSGLMKLMPQIWMFSFPVSPGPAASFTLRLQSTPCLSADVFSEFVLYFTRSCSLFSCSHFPFLQPDVAETHYSSSSAENSSKDKWKSNPEPAQMFPYCSI